MDNGLRPPAPFSTAAPGSNPSDVARNWDDWLDEFDTFMVASEKNEKDEVIQVAILINLLGREGKEVFRNLPLTNDEKKKIKAVKDAFGNHFRPRKNEVFERYRFHGRTQGCSESFETFLTALKTMSTTCNFSNDEVGKAIRDRIVIGIRNEDLRRRLLDVDDLELDKAVQMCQRQEVTQQYAEGMRRQQDTDTNPTGDMMVAAVGETSRTVISNFPVRNCGNCGGGGTQERCLPSIWETMSGLWKVRPFC